MVAQLDRVTDYESVGRGFESLPSHQERPEHIVFWSFFFCAWKGLEQHGRAAGEANNSPVGCCLVRGDHRPGMSIVEAVDRKISWLFCFVSYGCTVSARSVLSMSDYVGRCIALQSVPFFASGEQCQAEFCLHFRVGILEQFQQSRHRDKGYASAWAANPSGTLPPSRWAETINCHAHPRILLPQNRCLPEPFAAPFPRQLEPRCNTLDFAGKVVCQRDAASRLSARSGASKCAAF